MALATATYDVTKRITNVRVGIGITIPYKTTVVLTIELSIFILSYIKPKQLLDLEKLARKDKIIICTYIMLMIC